MTADELSEKLAEEFVNTVDTRTLDEGLTLGEAARVCQQVANALQGRATSLNDEAMQEASLEMED